MEKDTQNKINFIIKRVKEKEGVNADTTRKVLGAIADLAWDWEGSEFDIIGLDLTDTLTSLGKRRCPKDKKENLI